MRLSAYLPESDSPQLDRTYYSIGGGFVVDERESLANAPSASCPDVPHPFDSGDSLLAQCRENGLSIAGIALCNELAWRTEAQVREGLLSIWKVMRECIERGYRTEGVLPGPLGVRRHHRRAVQAQRLHIGHRGRLPRGGGRSLLDGGGLAVNVIEC